MGSLNDFPKWLSILLLLIIISGCAQQQRYQKPQAKEQTFDDSGIIYLDEEEPGVPKKETATDTKSGQQTQNQDNSIVYLGETGKQASVPQKNQQVVREAQFGKASYYADKFHGRKTASGELYDRDKLTAAHRTLPFGTICKVTNVANGKSVEVRVNDRGPFSKGRVIDVSYKAMSQLGGIHAGLIEVKVEALK